MKNVFNTVLFFRNILNKTMRFVCQPLSYSESTVPIKTKTLILPRHTVLSSVKMSYPTCFKVNTSSSGILTNVRGKSHH